MQSIWGISEEIRPLGSDVNISDERWSPTVTFNLWISPEKLFALPTRPATKSWFAQTLSCDLQETINTRQANADNTTHLLFCYTTLLTQGDRAL